MPEANCEERVRCTWSGDDGVSGSGKRIAHTYANPGQYAVRLTTVRVRGGGGGDDDDDDEGDDEEAAERTVTVTVRPAAPAPAPAPTPAPAPAPPAANRPPAVSFTSSTSGLKAQFVASTSDPDGDAVSLSWRFGDGATGSGQRPSRTYAKAGAYEVVLIARDRRGAERRVAARVRVEAGTTVSGESAPASPLAESPASVPAPPAPAVAPPAAAPVVTLLPMSPFPIVRVAGSVGRRGTRLSVVSVRGPRSARVIVRCLGRGRNCPFRRREHQARSSLSRALRLRGRLLRPGAVLDIRVVQPGRIGKRTRLRFRARRGPTRTDGCVDPVGAVRPCD